MSKPQPELQALTKAERTALERHESIVEQALKESINAARSLLEIRNQRLYRSTHPTFEKYCKDRWRFSRAQGNRLCTWAEVVGNLSPEGDNPYPLIEAHARPIATLPPDKQRKAMTRIVQSGATTQREIQKICHEVEHEDRPKQSNVVGKISKNAEHVICADVLHGLGMLTDGSVNLVVTSPPYADKRESHFPCPTEENFPVWMAAVMRSLKQKMAPDGSVLIIIRPHLKDGEISDYVLKTRLATRAEGWRESEELIWLKTDAPPIGSTRRPRRTWEHILWFSPSKQPFTDLLACGNKDSKRIGFEGSRRFTPGSVTDAVHDECEEGTAKVTDVFTAYVGEIERGIAHSAMFPQTLAAQLIQTFSCPDDLVLDCFCGSGSTLLAAQSLGRRYCGIDIVPEYVELCRRRLRERRSKAA